jgi:hypothetical protein
MVELTEHVVESTLHCHTKEKAKYMRWMKGNGRKKENQLRSLLSFLCPFGAFGLFTLSLSLLCRALVRVGSGLLRNLQGVRFLFQQFIPFFCCHLQGLGSGLGLGLGAGVELG